jgi:enoyl-CoA hydratase
VACVRVEREETVWRLTLDRPPANALELTLVTALGGALDAAAAAHDCSAIVLTGAGRFFSGGIDVKSVPAYDAGTRAAMLRAVNATLAALYGVPKPVVAALNGTALGGALVLALACDVRLAADGDHLFGLTESAAGIPFPAVPLRVVEAEITGRAARLATLASTTADPTHAVALGFVDGVTSAADLLPEATQHARALAALPAFATVKLQLRRRALDDMWAIVASDAEPLIAGWIRRCSSRTTAARRASIRARTWWPRRSWSAT